MTSHRDGQQSLTVSVEMSEKRLLTKLHWALIVTALVLGMFLLNMGPEASNRQWLSDIGTALIGSAIFAGIVSLMLERETTAFLADAVSAKVAQQFDAKFSRFQGADAVNAKYALDDVYPGFDGTFDPNFLRKFLESFKASNRLLFRGSSGKYVASYLKYLGLSDFDCRLLLIDPNDCEALKYRSQTRDPFSNNRTVTPLEELRIDIRDTLVALFEVRDMCSRLEVCLAPLTSTTRLELLDSNLFVGVYQQGNRFPDVLRYDNSKEHYKYNEKELIRQLQQVKGDKKIDLKALLDEGALESVLEQLGFVGDQSNLALIKEKVEKHHRKFYERCQTECGSSITSLLEPTQYPGTQ